MDGAGTFAIEQSGLVEIHHFNQFLGTCVAAGFALLDLFVVAVLDGFEVFELQLGVDGEFVAHRVDGAVDVGYVVVVEAAQHMDDSVAVAYVGKELVAQSFAF